MLDISSSEALQNNDSSNYGPNMDQTTAQTTAPCAWGIARDQPTDGLWFCFWEMPPIANSKVPKLHVNKMYIIEYNK